MKGMYKLPNLCMAVLCMIVSLKQANAQNINYTIVRDAPQEATKTQVNLNLANLDYNAQGFPGMTFVVLGQHRINDKILLDAYLSKAWWNWAKGVAGRGYKGQSKLELQVGGMYSLITSERSKSRRLILKSTSSRVNNTEYTSTTFINVNMKKLMHIGPRAGLHHSTSMVSLDEGGTVERILNGTSYPSQDARLSQTGFYAGLQIQSITNYFAEVSGYGKKGRAALVNVYADVMILPINSFAKSTAGINDVKDMLDKAGDKQGPFGWRIGAEWMPVAKKEDSRKKLYFTVSAGSKPYTGFFLQGGVGLTIYRR